MGLGLLVAVWSCGSDENKTDPAIILGELIEKDNGDARNPRLAMDPASGDAVAVWEQWDGRWYNIWANRYSAVTGWGEAELVDNIAAGNARNPEVVMDPLGNALVVWEHFNGIQYYILSAYYFSGVGWSAPLLLGGNNTGSSVNPKVAMDAVGNAIAVWQFWDGMRYNLVARDFTFGVGWGPPLLIELNDTGSAVNPHVAMDAATGDAITVWQHFDGTRYNIWAHRFVWGVGWTGPELIETQDLGRAVFPQVAMDPATGDALAVWQQFDGDRYNIWANRFASGVGWSGAQVIEIDDVGSDARPRIAMDPLGNVMAVWQQDDGGRYNVWANRFTAGAGWGAAELIELDNSGDAAEPRVVLNTAGKGMAVWQLWDGLRYNLWAREYSPGIGWGPVELIETNNAGDAWFPQVAMNDAGNALVVWKQDDGLRYNIWANWIK